MTYAYHQLIPVEFMSKYLLMFPSKHIDFAIIFGSQRQRGQRLQPLGRFRQCPLCSGVAGLESQYRWKFHHGFF